MKPGRLARDERVTPDRDAVPGPSVVDNLVNPLRTVGLALECTGARRVNHRGLDALRANGWRGSGYVRWREPGNLGFLRCLTGLGEMAAAIGEHDEAERISLFLGQLDPEGGPSGG